MKELTENQRTFLQSLAAETEMDAHGIPVYVLTAGDFSFVSDFKLPAKANKRFEKEAPAELYRGGAVIKVICQQGVLVVPDERYGWFKPFAGMARFAEGNDLSLTGGRELMEEAFVYDLKKTTRFVPQGWKEKASLSSNLDFTVQTVREIGAVEIIGQSVNETNRALEAVMEWDISGLAEPFSVNLEERWWNGGRNGIPVFVINGDGAIAGVFSGQQGFLEIPKFGIHETLRKYL
jgi:hypothetical protein